jgi:drug/metabolite transporter (DMT)-like permease
VLLGLAVGVIGVGTLAAGGPAWSDAGVQRLAIVGGGLSWAIGSIVARDGARPGSAAQSTAMQLAAGAVVVLVASAASGEPGAWHSAHLSVRGVASLGYLIICGTVLGFGAFTWLMRVTTAAMAGSSAFVNPVVALVLGWAVGDDTLSGRTLAAAVLVVAAVLLTWESPRAERRLPTGRAPTRAGGMQVDAAA